MGRFLLSPEGRGCPPLLSERSSIQFCLRSPAKRTQVVIRSTELFEL
jgi:hypothetical protein